MLDKKILILILPVILVVAINGIPLENSEANDTPKTEDTGPQKSNTGDTRNTPAESKGNGISTIKLEVPSEGKDGTSRPRLYLIHTPTTPAPTSKEQSSPTPIPASSPSTPASTANNTAPTEPKVDKDGRPRPILVLYSPRTDTTVTPSSTPTTPRPILVLYLSNTTTSTAAPISTTTTPRPIFVFYSPNTTSTTAATTSTTDATTSTTDASSTTTPRPIFVFYSPNTTSTTTTVASTITAPVSTSAPVSTATLVPTPTPLSTPTAVPTAAVTSPSTDSTVKRFENFLRGYNCPQRNGFFRYPDSCDVYIACEDYIPLTYICPDGLQFNPNAKQHDHVCDDPSVVKCKMGKTAGKQVEPTSTVRPILILSSLRSTARPAHSNVMHGYRCPSRQGFFSYPGSCDSYIMCEVHTPYRHTCPPGLHFKPDALWTEYPCVEPSMARCGNAPWGY